MDSLKKTCLEWIEENKKTFFKMADAIWEHPELSMQEHFASKLLTDFLKEEGYEVELGMADMPTAFTAAYGTEGPVIGFSCEYDALPGLSQDKSASVRKPLQEDGPGHGCGHNLMAVGGLMAASAVKALIDGGKLQARIRIFGTPAEELCIGKPFMARAGCFNDVDCVLDWHPMCYSKAGYNESVAYFNCKYHFRGKSAHGNAPWFGKSALDAGILMSNALEFLREHLPPGQPGRETTMNYNINSAGGGPNVVPDKATVWCIGRMGTAEEIKEMKRRVDLCAEGAALATETEVEKELITVTHEKLTNKTISEVMQRNFEYAGTPEFSEEELRLGLQLQRQEGVTEEKMGKSVEPFAPAGMPVNDSSEYSWFAPMDIALIEMAPAGIGWHNWMITGLAGGSAGKKAVTTASRLLSCTAVELIENQEILVRAKEELKERLRGRTYQPLFDETIKPAVSIHSEEMKRFRQP